MKSNDSYGLNSNSNNNSSNNNDNSNSSKWNKNDDNYEVKKISVLNRMFFNSLDRLQK